jgi:hypothetical protein
MILVAPEDLNFAQRLSAIRRPPVAADGPANWSRYHCLSYEGSAFLTFGTTDSRVTMVSRLYVKDDDHPWECPVERRNFDHFARLANGGRFTLDARPGRAVLARKFHKEWDGREFEFQYPLFRGRSTTPFPEVAIPPETVASATVPLNAFRTSLGFLTRPREERDLECRVDTCTFVPNGEAIGWHQDVFLRTVSPTLPFEVNVHAADAARLWQWLGLIDNGHTTEIRLTCQDDTLAGRAYYLFWTPDGAHRFKVVACRRPLPGDFIRNVDGESTAPVAVVPRKALQEIAWYFGQYNGCHLILKVTRDDDGTWNLHAALSDETLSGGGRIPVDVKPGPGEVTSLPPVRVSPADLFVAVDRLKGHHVLLQHHRRCRATTLSDEPTGAGIDVVRRAYLHVAAVLLGDASVPAGGTFHDSDKVEPPTAESGVGS